MNRRLTILLLLASLSNFVLGAALATWFNASPATPPVTTAAAQERATSEPAQPVQLRIFDLNGTLLFTTWPDEDGSFVKEYGNDTAGEPQGPVTLNWTRWPPLFQPIADITRQATNGSVLRLATLMLPAAPGETLDFPRTLTLDRDGVLPREQARNLLGPPLDNTTALYGGAIPVHLDHVTSDTVHYHITLGEGAIPLPRTDGLRLTNQATLEDAKLQLRLDPTAETFAVVGGCQLGPHTLRPGYYRVLREDAANLHLLHYPTGLDYALGGRTVTVEVTLV